MSFFNITKIGNNLTETAEYSRYPGRECLPRSVSRSPRTADTILQSSETLVPQSSPIPLLSPRREHQPIQSFSQNPQNSQLIQSIHSQQQQQQQQQQQSTHLLSLNGNISTVISNNGSITSQDENEVMPSLSFLANYGQPLISNIQPPPEKTTPLIVPSSDNLTFTGTPYTGFIPAPAETVCEAGRKTPSIPPITTPTNNNSNNNSATISSIPNSITPSSFHLTSPFGMVPCIDLNENLNIANNVNNIKKSNNNNNANNISATIPSNANINNNNIGNNIVGINGNYLRQIKSGSFNPIENYAERRYLDVVRMRDDNDDDGDDDEYEDDDDGDDECEEDEYDDDYDMENDDDNDEDYGAGKDAKTRGGIKCAGNGSNNRSTTTSSTSDSRKRSLSSKKIRVNISFPFLSFLFLFFFFCKY